MSFNFNLVGRFRDLLIIDAATATRSSNITREGAVRNCQRTGIADAAAAETGGIVGEGAVRHRQRAVILDTAARA